MRLFSVLPLIVTVALALVLGGCGEMSSHDGAAHANHWSSGGQSEASQPQGGLYRDYGDANVSQDAGATGGADAGFSATSDAGSTAPKIPKSLPYVLASAQARSTFAADVDTASFDIFLRDLGYDVLPPSSTVRLEEYVNAFAYNDARPPTTGDVPFAISFETALSPFDKDVRLVRVGLAGRKVQKDEKKATNLVFLIDVSGSMQSSAKLPLVKKVISSALNELDPTDTVSLVTYAGKTSVRLSPTVAKNATTILSALNSLKASGSTNGAGGIQLAYQQAEKAFLAGGINHVVLCTDGDFNVGTSNTKALVKLIEEKRKTGITLTVLGFGQGNLNDSMMEAVSNAGDGIYAVIRDAKHAQMYGQNGLLATIQHIAKDVKIQVQWNPQHVRAWRLLGYANRQLTAQQFNDKTADAGEIGSGHKVTAIFEVVMLKGEIPAPEYAPKIVDTAPLSGGVTETLDVLKSDIALVKVRYKLPGAKASDPSKEIQATLPISWQPGDLANASADLRWATGVASMAEVLMGSPFRDKLDLKATRTLLSGSQGADADRIYAWPMIDKALNLLSK